MDKKLLTANIIYLLEKYLNNRSDLAELIQQDPDSVKYILSEIDKGKNTEYEEPDLVLIIDISFYYL